RVMYDGAPRTYGTFHDLRTLLVSSGGDLTTLDHADFDRWLTTPVDGATALEQLTRNGLEVATRDGDIIEKAGLMGLAGALREISNGRFPAGSRLLVNITGGTGQPRGSARPEQVIGASRSPA